MNAASCGKLNSIDVREMSEFERPAPAKGQSTPRGLNTLYYLIPRAAVISATEYRKGSFCALSALHKQQGPRPRTRRDRSVSSGNSCPRNRSRSQSHGTPEKTALAGETCAHACQRRGAALAYRANQTLKQAYQHTSYFKRQQSKESKSCTQPLHTALQLHCNPRGGKRTLLCTSSNSASTGH